MAEWMKERWEPLSARKLARAGYVLLGLALALNLGRIGKVAYQARARYFYEVTEGTRVLSYFEVIRWLGQNANAGDLVVTHEDRLIHYFTRLRTLRTDRLSRSRLRSILARTSNNVYLVRELRRDQRDAPLVGHMISAHPALFEEVGHFEPLVLVRVRPDKLEDVNHATD